MTVTIIGGGVIGCLTARALTRYDIRVVLLEKHSDTCFETSKANSALVHAGFDATVGSAKALFNLQGNRMMADTCKELGVHYKNNGALVLAFEGQLPMLDELLRRGQANGVSGLSVLSKDRVKELEPNISDEISGALLAETGGIVCPYMLTHQAAANAVQNGAEVKTNSEVIGITQLSDKTFVIQTTKEEIHSDYIVNAAGLYSDKIAKLAGDDGFSINPRRGQYLLFDKRLGNLVSHTIFQLPTKMGKGIVVSPTVDGNLLIGPNAENISAKDQTQTTADGLAEVIIGAKRSVPAVTPRDVITSFSGVRAVSSTDDFIIGPSKTVSGLYHAAGIQSPGLTAAPAIAKHLAEVLAKEAELKLNSGYNPTNEKPVEILRLTVDELNALIKKNPAYGKIVCRCETVSEGQIVSAVEKGARDLDGVKRRTRAGMGRCQGGFCMPKVLDIISRETGKKYTEITKNDDGSYILTGETKVGG